MLLNSTSKCNSQMLNKMQAKSSFASIPTWSGQYKSYHFVEKSKCDKIYPLNTFPLKFQV